MAEFRHPNITAASPEGQLTQIKTYLYQLTNQLNYAVKSVENEEKARGYNSALTGNITGAGEKSDDEKAQSTFNDIKDLIIKSADIVYAYYDVISKKLEGDYKALSRTDEGYDAFVQNTTQWQQKSSENNDYYFKSVQKISKYLGHELDENGKPIIADGERLSEIRTDDFYIKTGWIDNDEYGNLIGGIELGQVSTDGANSDVAFAHFTTEELAFFDANKNRVAKFSNNLLEITNAKIDGTLELKDYVLDNSDGIAFLWAGDD